MPVTQIAFVATNSITQGEQVAQLWPLLFDRYRLEISFAHRTFAWGSDARGKAHVHVVIIGLSKREFEPLEKRLFSYDDINGDPVESKHRSLSPYLTDAAHLRDRHLTVADIGAPLCDIPKAIIGSKPIDGGYLILDADERATLFALEPQAEKYLRPFIGSVDYIQGGGRWILALQDASPDEIRSMPAVVERLRQVREYRSGARPAKNKTDDDKRPPGISSRALADTPSRFHVTVIPASPFLVVPEVSSERREYVPIGWLEPPTIPSNLVRIIPNADRWHFGVLTSRMHMAWLRGIGGRFMAWLRGIGGRLESRYRYSISIVYNTFPWPDASEPQKLKIRELAQNILQARTHHPTSSLADLYDPDTMPDDLRKAHYKLDIAVDALYKRGGFESDRERVEHLFTLYEKLVAPLTAVAGKKPRAKRMAPSPQPSPPVPRERE